MQKLINKSFKLSENEIHFLSILKEKYHIKINRFVRDAIITLLGYGLHITYVVPRFYLCVLILKKLAIMCRN